jgi:hypothetical protein
MPNKPKYKINKRVLYAMSILSLEAASASNIDIHRYAITRKLQVNVRLSLYLINYAMKSYGGVEVTVPSFLTSALDGDEWSASSPSRFTPGERALGNHWTGA